MLLFPPKTRNCVHNAIESRSCVGDNYKSPEQLFLTRAAGSVQQQEEDDHDKEGDRQASQNNKAALE